MYFFAHFLYVIGLLNKFFYIYVKPITMLNLAKSQQPFFSCHNPTRNLVIFFILKLFFINNVCSAQTKSWDKLLFGTKVSAIFSFTDVEIDKFDNKFVLNVNLDTEEPRDSAVVFLNKYNQFDELVWSKKILEGTRFNPISFVFKVDGRGNIYLGLNFSKQIVIDGYLFKSKGETDGLLLKADTNGNLLFAKQFGDICNDVIGDIIFDEIGNIYFGGQFGYAAFDSNINCNVLFEDKIFFNDAYLNSNYFLIKLDKSGKMLWHNIGGGSGYDAINYIAINDNRIYFSANSSSISKIDLNGYHLGMSKTISSSMFFAMLDAKSGETLWANVVGNSGALNRVSAKGITATKFGVSLIGTLDTGDPGQRNRLIIRSSEPLIWEGLAEPNYFVLNYDTTGNLNWAKKGLENVRHNIKDILTDNKYNTYVLGYGSDSFIFAEDTILSYGSNDAFITCYNKNGDEMWIKTAGGEDVDRVHSMTFDRLERIYISGSTRSSILKFDSIITESPHSDILFLARLSDDPILNIIPINKNLNQTTVYPNPANKQLWLQQNANKQNIKNLLMYNVQGNLINQNFKTTNAAFNVEHLATGIYFLNIVYANGTQQTIKWCKQ